MEDKKMGMLVAREDPISIGVLLFPPPPRLPPTPQVFKQSCNPLFTHCIRCSLKRTTQWLKERNG